MPKPIDYYQNVIIKSVQKISNIDYEEWSGEKNILTFKHHLNMGRY